MNWFALATYRADDGAARTGIVIDDHLIDLVGAASRLGHALPVDATLDGLIRSWVDVDGSIKALAAVAADALKDGRLSGLVVADPSLLLPFHPRRVFATASNFIEHAAEMETVLAEKVNSQPYVFMKSPDSAIATGETVVIPAQVERADWEVELGVVIGKPGKRIALADAVHHIAGYVVVNDVSARDQTRRNDFPFKHDWFRGKSYDTFLPLGPWFVPRDCLGDPHAFRMGLSVNGETMQDGSTGEMIFNVFEQIQYLSAILTLQPGDVIATGTPAGVGMGRGVYLKDGDVMRAWIDGIGEIVNPVAAERIEP
ncbi:fumarylacetoacetate hydrolase family protein [Pseudokordiimonas caeni]|uniref:fumarylacetoacetate hydrolase family protein n=1 Tax=Pseudokordiimonas caeni TaxID=2997908 RepID=UPI002811AD3E|nr:fumarylacetoacetate hydrolase family protein [Pseudokordiimonas caeni]